MTTKDLAKLYLNTTDSLVKSFVSKYYTDEEWDDARYYIIWSYDPDGIRCFPWPVCINDDIFWNIDNIREALYHNIPKDKLMEWYEYRSDFNMWKWDSKEDPTNLVTRFLWEKEYTEEDRQESQERIKWIYDELMKCAEENKSDEFKAKEEREKIHTISFNDIDKNDGRAISVQLTVYGMRKALQEYDREHLLD